jgi:hypothetical protein
VAPIESRACANSVTSAPEVNALSPVPRKPIMRTAGSRSWSATASGMRRHMS